MPHNDKVKPSMQRVERGDDTERLYKLEHERNEIILACALEWGRIQGFDAKERWSRLIPQALFDTLESYERASAILAAQAYLELQGYTVTPTATAREAR